MGTGPRKPPQFQPLPENEAEFLRVLRASALAGVDLRTGEAPEGLSQAELERHTGMSRPSVVNLVKHFRPVLIDERGGAARATRIALDPLAGVAVGVDIGYAHLHVAASDLCGRISVPADPARYERRTVDEIDDADAALEWVARAIEQRLAELGRSADDVVGVGVAIAGPVDRDRGILRTPLFRAVPESPPDWQLFGVRDHLRRRLGWENVPFLIDNDSNLRALAEYTWGAARPREDRRYENVIYLDWSHGIGAGLILGGELYFGAGVAGEIGHAVIDADGPECPRCGNRGCLEALAAWPALRRQIRDAPSVDAALQLARDGDGAAQRAFAAAAERVAQVLGPLISILNPDLVLIGGTIGQAGYDVVRPPLLRELSRRTMRPALQDVEFTAATLAASSIQGTIALVLRAPRDSLDPLLGYLQRAIRRRRNGG